MKKMGVSIGSSGVIARFVGKACVALGFILGIYGLTDGRPGLLKVALSVLVTGIVASAYGLYSHLHPPAPSVVAPSRPEPAETDSFPEGRAPSRLGASHDDETDER